MRMNIRLEGHVLITAYIYTSLDKEWFYYNVAAGSFYTKKLCSRLYLTELKFYSKKLNALLEPPFEDLGVTYALHL